MCNPCFISTYDSRTGKLSIYRNDIINTINRNSIFQRYYIEEFFFEITFFFNYFLFGSSECIESTGIAVGASTVVRYRRTGFKCVVK